MMKEYDSIAITERVKKLKATVVEAVPEICIERAKIVTEAYQKYEAYPVIVKRALSLKMVLEKMNIYVEKGELIVGNQAYRTRCAPIFPEYSWDWILDEIDEFEKRKTDRFVITEKSKQELREILPYWRGKTLRDTAETCQTQEVFDATKVGIIEWVGNVTSGEGHIAVDYKMCMDMGFGGIKAWAEKRLESLNLSKPESVLQQDFLKAVVIVMQAGIDFGKRFFSLVQKELTELPEDQKKILSVLQNVPENPPKTLHEALQMLWFAHLILQIEASGHSMSMGRVDQYLYPYYLHDIENGILSNADVVELLDCFYIKLFSINKLRTYGHSRVLAGYPTYQNISVGGQKADGSDAVNNLSYCMLKALSHVQLSEPNFYIRYHKNISQDFMHKALEVVSQGNGMPAFLNDKVCIASLMDRGISYEDAVEYSSMGCLEIEVPGKWGYRANGKSKFNMAKVLELAIYGGEDPRTGIRLCDTGKSLKNCKSYEEFFELYKMQMNFFIRLQVEADNINDNCMRYKVPDAFCSALVNDCIKRGKSIKEGGPVYDWVSGAQLGVPNVGNSLAALKKVVFEDKTYTAEEVEEALRNNFSTEKGRLIRKALMDSPKYGNDDNSVDYITKQAFDVYCEKILTYKNMREGMGPKGCGWYASTVTLTSNIPGGEIVGALPDGRLAKTPLADGISPEHGTEHEGPTAVANSAAKLSTRLVTGGQLLNMRFVPELLKNKKGCESVRQLIHSFFEQDGWHIQFNVVSTEMLLDAKKHPSKYKDLVIRVAGYSALFIALDPAIQDDIISRSQYTL